MVRKRQCTCPSPARLRRRGCWRRSNRTNLLANLLGTAGVNVVVLEKNDGLVGLPRAIAYDPETLRLFAQVGLFDRIVDGLRSRTRQVTRLSQRSRRQTHGDNFATKRVRLFPAWHFLPAALRTGAVRWACTISDQCALCLITA